MKQAFAFLFIAAISLLIWSAWQNYIEQQYKYVRGRFGEDCYIVGHQNKNIHFPVYYRSLTDCQNAANGY